MGMFRASSILDKTGIKQLDSSRIKTLSQNTIMKVKQCTDSHLISKSDMDR